MTGEAAVLARALDYAGCNAAQASAVLLFHTGLSTADVARALRLPYKAAKALVSNGVDRLEKAHRSLLAKKLRWYRTILQLSKNQFDVDPRHSVSRDCRPAALLTYAPIPGGFDARPVTVRARPHGSVAEDFLEDPSDLLRALIEALA